MADHAAAHGALGKDLYMIVTVPNAPREEIMKMLPIHLERQIELEKAGILFMAGPFWERGTEGTADGGMILVRANSFEEADEIAKGDPFHKAGLRTYTIRRWMVNEGSYTVTVTYSDQKMAIA
jgi:uncharacterized protein YciI